MKLLTELKVPVKYNEDDIFLAIKRKYSIQKSEIKFYEIVKSSLDCRKKPEIVCKLNVAVSLAKNSIKKFKRLDEIEVDHSGIEVQKIDFSFKRPVVVGFGPAGIFAGLTLALAGLKPIILEQGKKVDERQKDIDEFIKTRKLNEYSNIQFGEGGAGTFSDGKLASNVSNKYTKKVINEFILAGAPEEIFYSSTPHIGSDKLKGVVSNLRKKIENLGGEVRFSQKFISFLEDENGISSVVCKDIKTDKTYEIETDALVLCVGHSADDVYEMLDKKKVKMVQKPFAMGVRIEQLQSDINFAQYGIKAENLGAMEDVFCGLPPANYKLAVHLENGRSVFTFCMCPGGVVVPAVSTKGTVVTNGMSNYLRSGKNANSAVLVNVLPSDFGGEDALAGVRFQRKYEKLAFILGGENYNAPAQRVDDFLKDRTPAKECRVSPTYLPAVKFAKIKDCLPDFVTASLKLALPEFDKKIKGFASDDNLLIAIESRSSAPLQIERDENLMTELGGLFVSGEGAGFAGGITSSSADGIKCAENVIKYLKEKSSKNSL